MEFHHFLLQKDKRTTTTEEKRLLLLTHVDFLSRIELIIGHDGHGPQLAGPSPGVKGEGLARLGGAAASSTGGVATEEGGEERFGTGHVLVGTYSVLRIMGKRLSGNFG